ncbi:hypothetical protein [Aliidiomarina indica]|uniref:hypothetical protein n=1 Tax=Aliidiomarina indica TaxID=2749147 RepID=UPI00188F8123|nr:hypothetical protein [Aliidiomarina indica]
MNEIFGAILFTVFVASAGLGIASIICALMPSTVSDDEQERARDKIESIFFGAAGVIIALVMVVAMIFNAS